MKRSDFIAHVLTNCCVLKPCSSKKFEIYLNLIDFSKKSAIKMDEDLRELYIEMVCHSLAIPLPEEIIQRREETQNNRSNRAE